MNVNVVGIFAQQSAAQLASEGNYTKARMKQKSAMRMVNRNIDAIKGDEDRSAQLKVWNQEATRLNGVLKSKKIAERKKGLNYNSSSEDDSGDDEDEMDIPNEASPLALAAPQSDSTFSFGNYARPKDDSGFTFGGAARVSNQMVSDDSSVGSGFVSPSPQKPQQQSSLTPFKAKKTEKEERQRVRIAAEDYVYYCHHCSSHTMPPVDAQLASRGRRRVGQRDRPELQRPVLELFDARQEEVSVAVQVVPLS